MLEARELREHVYCLAEGLEVRVRELPDVSMTPGEGFPPRAYVERRVIDTFPVVDRRTYRVACHELGHCAHGDLPYGSKAEKLSSEVAAWSWAQAVGVLPWTSWDADFARRTLAVVGDERDVADGDLAGYLARWLRLTVPGSVREA